MSSVSIEGRIQLHVYWSKLLYGETNLRTIWFYTI